MTGAREFLGFLSAKHLAGLRERPSGAETERLFRARSLTWRESSWLRHIFLCLHAGSFRKLVLGAGLSVYEVARAAHNSGIERGELAFWFDPYAIRPEDLPRVPEEEWRKLRRAKEEAWGELESALRSGEASRPQGGFPFRLPGASRTAGDVDAGQLGRPAPGHFGHMIM